MLFSARQAQIANARVIVRFHAAGLNGVAYSCRKLHGTQENLLYLLTNGRHTINMSLQSTTLSTNSPYLCRTWLQVALRHSR